MQCYHRLQLILLIKYVFLCPLANVGQLVKICDDNGNLVTLTVSVTVSVAVPVTISIPVRIRATPVAIATHRLDSDPVRSAGRAAAGRSSVPAAGTTRATGAAGASVTALASQNRLAVADHAVQNGTAYEAQKTRCWSVVVVSVTTVEVGISFKTRD